MPIYMDIEGVIGKPPVDFDFFFHEIQSGAFTLANTQPTALNFVDGEGNGVRLIGSFAPGSWKVEEGTLGVGGQVLARITGDAPFEGDGALSNVAARWVSEWIIIQSIELTGGRGTERLTGGDANDVLDGGAGGDLLRGGGGNDRLLGRNGDDYLHGQNGNDVLIGGNGNDVLIGGTGNNRLVGGADTDLFMIESASAAGTSRVRDFGADDVLAIAELDKSTPVLNALSGDDGPGVLALSDVFEFRDNLADLGRRDMRDLGFVARESAKGDTIVVVGDQRMILLGVGLGEIPLEHFLVSAADSDDMILEINAAAALDQWSWSGGLEFAGYGDATTSL